MVWYLVWMVTVGGARLVWVLVIRFALVVLGLWVWFWILLGWLGCWLVWLWVVVV